MSALQSLDAAVFRFINGTLSNAFFDWLMPILAGGDWFLPLVLAGGGLWIWRGGKRACLCVLMLAIVIPVGDGWITNTLKKTLGRPRPCLTQENVNLPMKQDAPKPGEENPFRVRGCSDAGSMPSGHTTNWFAASMVVWIFYRRSFWFMVPMAAAVGFSRIYNGVHYPGDVLVGAIVGAGYGLALSIGANAVWRRTVAPLFPRWCANLPSLLPSAEKLPEPQAAVPSVAVHWLRLGLILILGVLAFRLWYAGTDRIDLSADEAFRWLWAKRLGTGDWLGTPLGVWWQWTANQLFGDHEFTVRFVPPICTAVISYVVLRFFMAYVSARAGFWLVIILQVTPLLMVGPSLLGVDTMLVFFWSLAVFSGWRAVQPQATTKDWALVGLWLGLAALANHAAILLWLCWLPVFVLRMPLRAQLRKAGPWSALAIALALVGPALVWKVMQEIPLRPDWSEGVDLGPGWRSRFDTTSEFLGLVVMLANPVFVMGALWALASRWMDERYRALVEFMALMSAPVLAACFIPGMGAQLRLNWIAASVIPLSCLLVAFWRREFGHRPRLVSWALASGLVYGVAATALLHESGLTKSFTGSRLPVQFDPLQRVRGWTGLGRTVSRERTKLLAEGKPVFVIGDNFGTASLLTFYMAQARTNAEQLVFIRSDAKVATPMKSWPSYVGARAGQNALYVQDAETPDIAPPTLTRQFASVTNAGTILIHHRGRTLRNMRLFICRDLQP